MVFEICTIILYILILQKYFLPQLVPLLLIAAISSHLMKDVGNVITSAKEVMWCLAFNSPFICEQNNLKSYE